MDLLESEDGEYSIVADILTRLYEQGIIQCNISGLGWSLAAPGGNQEVLCTILPTVRYDYRIVYFLSYKSENRLVNTAKAPIASIILSVSNVCAAEPAKADDEAKVMRQAWSVGFFEICAQDSTFTMAAGSLKTLLK